MIQNVQGKRNAEPANRRDRQGWNPKGRIILGRDFLSVGMKSAGKNHPWKRFFIGRDEIRGEESSLEEIFYRQGWNSWERIILGRDFLSAGMKSEGKNHPWKRFFIGRDEIRREKSSLEEIFYWQGWKPKGRIILGRGFLSVGIKSASARGPRSRNCPHMRFYLPAFR